MRASSVLSRMSDARLLYTYMLRASSACTRALQTHVHVGSPRQVSRYWVLPPQRARAARDHRHSVPLGSLQRKREGLQRRRVSSKHWRVSLLVLASNSFASCDHYLPTWVFETGG